jgi:hypothetical protein
MSIWLTGLQFHYVSISGLEVAMLEAQKMFMLATAGRPIGSSHRLNGSSNSISSQTGLHDLGNYGRSPNRDVSSISRKLDELVSKGSN